MEKNRIMRNKDKYVVVLRTLLFDSKYFTLHTNVFYFRNTKQNY